MSSQVMARFNLVHDIVITYALFGLAVHVFPV